MAPFPWYDLITGVGGGLEGRWAAPVRQPGALHKLLGVVYRFYVTMGTNGVIFVLRHRTKNILGKQ